jgi:hypothetical protein
LKSSSNSIIINQIITTSFQINQLFIPRTNSTIPPIPQLLYVKMFSKTFIATLLASTAVATPIVARTSNKAFKLISFAFGPGSPIQGSDIVAYNGGLWIGKNTTSYCPENIDCPGKHDQLPFYENQDLIDEQPALRPHSSTVTTRMSE